MPDPLTQYTVDVSEIMDCLELLRRVGLEVVAITNGGEPVAYLVPLPLINSDIEMLGYGDVIRIPNED
jgi:hypothetical protein